MRSHTPASVLYKRVPSFTPHSTVHSTHYPFVLVGVLGLGSRVIKSDSTQISRRKDLEKLGCLRLHRPHATTDSPLLTIDLGQKVITRATHEGY